VELHKHLALELSMFLCSDFLIRYYWMHTWRVVASHTCSVQ